jgi:hypothetical protein
MGENMFQTLSVWKQLFGEFTPTAERTAKSVPLVVTQSSKKK